ncbi:DUF4301 family protein [bacterium]|nr:DUF4301 family protein [bacterium]
MPYSFTPDNLKQIRSKGIDPETVIEQLDIFRNGIAPVRLNHPCKIGDGIAIIADREIASLLASHREACGKSRVSKFVPASGAATRMFKPLISIYKSGIELTRDNLESLHDNPDAASVLKFCHNLPNFAFYYELSAKKRANHKDLEKLLECGDYGEILRFLLEETGLNYVNLPKGLIAFHRVDGEPFTPFHEHILEGIEYAKDESDIVRIHFTIAEEHLPAVKRHIDNVINKYILEGVRFEITYSIQKPSTDTIAVDMNNEPFRDENGEILFRPGGHGALLENLNDLKGDLICIKNIDNAANEKLRGDSVKYMKLLCGMLVKLQERIFDYLRRLEINNNQDILLPEIGDFIKKELHIKIQKHSNVSSPYLIAKKYFEILNRPIRICGMVKNISAPGGGPFWVNHNDGSVSLQIVESAQVDMNSDEQRGLWESATHFNPVFMVCGVKDHWGEPFDLMKYRDPDTGFITKKSKAGLGLKALELPGLWNGSMAFWNTIFVETPLTVFNPVKTVNDLLKPEHQ